MAFMLSSVRGALGFRSFVGQCYVNRSSGIGALYKSQQDLILPRRLISVTRSHSGAVNSANGHNAAPAGRSPETDSSATKVKTVDGDENYTKGKYPGTGAPKAVGQPEDLPSIEFGKPTGMYNFVRHQHGDPRGHLQSDGRFRPTHASDSFHWYDAYTDVPKQRFTIVNGETMIMGKETRPMEELFGVPQTNIPFHPRRRMNLWGNHRIVLGAEFCFFWIPTLIILGLAVPCYTMIYMMDEAVATSMTVKVVGHQWYWVYEVESPPLVE
ncbi:cytochrome c oxidase subunit [Babesia ovata]|uniref:Cytochrome c oxidase subunit n=1 Tax=Babesia ovata TaxID=189622 RepID=A0A2H6KGH6_9APIC|nr:cytochrome c oxidase subunit [Babesia ovata]GBE62095.1 cytochrome c oxidase subunit [Babesia ovata]